MPPIRRTRVLTEARVREIIQALLKKELRRLSLTAGVRVQAVVKFDGHGDVIDVGSQFDLRVEQEFVVNSWVMLADRVGSIQVDVFRDTFLNFPPTDADAMPGGGNEPAIVADDTATGTTAGWTTTTVNSGDIIRFNVDSVATIEECTLILVGTKT